MLRYAFPVAWRDLTADGLNGVIDIQSSDFCETNNEEILVRDVVDVLTKKLRSSSGDDMEVTRIMLHGVRLDDDIPLSRVVPELAGSSPRFSAMTQTPQRLTMTLFVFTLTGKKLTVYCSPTNIVYDVKVQIEEEEGIPQDQQRLVYAGKQLKDYHTLSHYNISDKCTLHLVLRLRGGDNSRTFADVSDGSLLTALEFSPDAPEWRVCTKGLNIEGCCKNSDCRAYRHMIIDPKGYTLFNLIRDDNVRCPICHWKVDPVTCGLYDCCWRYEGIKASDNVSMCSQWKDARGHVYHRFDCGEDGGCVEWESLLITVKSIDDAAIAKLVYSSDPTDISPDDKCTICWTLFGGTQVNDSYITSHCGHSFHRVCLNEWSAWCERNDTQPSCLICCKMIWE